MHPTPQQIAGICRIAHDNSLRGSGRSLRELLEATEYRQLRADLTEPAIADYLASHPDVASEWSMYSDDKRTSGGWYFVHRDHRWIVGRVESEPRHDEREYESRLEACAHFILLELDFWASLSES